MRGFWPRVFVALFAPVAIGLIVSSSVFSCYATTGPTPPTCSADPTQPWCPPPIHDERVDAGR